MLAMADWREAAHAFIMALVFAFMLAKLLSLLTAFKSDNLRVERARAADAPAATPAEAQLAPGDQNGFDGDLDSSDDEEDAEREEEDDSSESLDVDVHQEREAALQGESGSSDEQGPREAAVEAASGEGKPRAEEGDLSQKSAVAEEPAVSAEPEAAGGDELDENDSDDWEGVESSELEEEFGAASTFVATMATSMGSKTSQDMQLQLYALYKVATEGPCRTPQPSLINMTARAKWNAWQKLGDISPEEAMVRYIEVLTKISPNWNQPSEKADTSGGSLSQTSGSKRKPSGVGGPVFSTLVSEEGSNDSGSLEAIHTFAKDGDSAGLSQLLDQGQPVDQKDSQGRTALHWAVDHGHLETVKFLLSKGAEIQAKDQEGQTALHYATICEHENVAKLLVEKGADPSVHDNEGLSPNNLRPGHWDWMLGSL